MNAALVHSELNFNYRLFCKTVSKSANWGFDRFRLFHPKWHTKIQVRRPDGSILGTQQFDSDNTYEHDFSFDLSGNVNKEEYSVYIAGVAEGEKFNQAYAYPTGYGATYGKNAEITFWDFSQVNVEHLGTTGRIRFENNPLNNIIFNEVAGQKVLDCAEVDFTNCQLKAETLSDALIALNNSGITGGSFKYSGNDEPPAERALDAYNSLKGDKNWILVGEVPSDGVAFEQETIDFMTAISIPDDSNSSIYNGLTNSELWGVINDFTLLQKSRSYLAKLKAEYLYIGDSAIQHKYNFLNPEDTDAAFRLSFAGSWEHSKAGIQGNGANTEALTYLVPSVHLAENDESFGFYSITDSDGDYVDIGAYGSPDDNAGSFIFANRAGKIQSRNQTNLYPDSEPNTQNSLGFYGLRRIEGSRYFIRKNQTENELIVPSYYLVDVPFKIGNMGDSAVSFFSNRQYAYHFIGLGLTATELENLKNDVESLQVALNRAV